MNASRRTFLSGMMVAAIALTQTGCQTSKTAEGRAAGIPDGPKTKVALYVDTGCRGGGVIHLARLLKSSPEVDLSFVTAKDVLDGKLKGIDVLVMPGGWGLIRHKKLGDEGFEAICRYIREGGRYYGICAGIAMALNDPGRLRLIPYTREKTPNRGGLSAAVQLSKRAEELLGVPAGCRYFSYHNGPIPTPGDPIPDSEYETIATFDCQVMQKGKEISPMHGMPAMIYGRYGKGKVFVSVVHPEYFPSTHDVLAGGFKALTGRPVTFRLQPKSTFRPLRVAYYATEIDGTGKADTLKTVKEALELDARKDVDVLFVSSEAISQGALDHVDVLVIPGGYQKFIRPEARILVDRFKAQGQRIVTSPSEL